MVAKGWGGLSPWHADTVFRTNVQSAYSVGEYRQFTKHQERFPAWEYQATDDSRVRLAHFSRMKFIRWITHTGRPFLPMGAVVMCGQCINTIGQDLRSE
jgi:hypothetical protein